MSLSSGQRLGPYEILAAIGAGGMGEVYRARDTRLDRTVAVKVLPVHLAQREELRERLEREARAVSSLNHPHICALFDVGCQDGVDFLVLEYLQGETLEARLARGPMPLDQALRCAADIASALAAAHQVGITHRDLKPGNIMLTQSGPTHMDFGLAKTRSEAAISSASNAPTIAPALTTEGTILGTLQYMSPEQIEGKDTDARSDIFALGATLYEMVTGRKAFEGATQASLLAAILEREPVPMATLIPMTPTRLDRLVTKCLAKDADQRWQSPRDLEAELTWLLEPESDAQRPSPRSRLPQLLAWSVAAAAVGILWFVLLAAPDARETASFKFTIQPNEVAYYSGGHVASLSPDGRYLAFLDRRNGILSLWLRPLDSTEVRKVPGSDNAASIFWSPDSKFIGFAADGKLYKIAVEGASPEAFGAASRYADGAWGTDGTLVFGAIGLMRVNASGGNPTMLPGLEQQTAGRYYWEPQFLPDGRHILYLMEGRERGVYVRALDSSEAELLLPGNVHATYVDPGFLFVVRDGKLMAYPFDARERKITGEPISLAEGVGPRVSASDTGVLAYNGAGTLNTQIVVRDRKGTEIGSYGAAEPFWQVRLSPDGQRMALNKFDAKTGFDDIWLFNLVTHVFQKLTLDPAGEFDPVWSPDGHSIAFVSNRTGNKDVYRIDVGGGAVVRIGGSDKDEMTEEWTRNNALVLHTDIDDQGDVVLMPVAAGEKTETLMPSEGFEVDEFKLSPNEKWIVYSTRQSGRYEIWLASYPKFTERRQVSDQGGTMARWGGDGKELFYLALDGRMMAVDVTVGSTINTGTPRSLFQTRIPVTPGIDQFDVTPDGQRFVLLERPESELPPPITVITNWPALLKR